MRGAVDENAHLPRIGERERVVLRDQRRAALANDAVRGYAAEIGTGDFRRGSAVDVHCVLAGAFHLATGHRQFRAGIVGDERMLAAVRHRTAAHFHARAAGSGDAMRHRRAYLAVLKHAFGRLHLHPHAAREEDVAATENAITCAKQVHAGILGARQEDVRSLDLCAVQRAHAIAGRAKRTAAGNLHCRAILGVEAILAGAVHVGLRHLHFAILADVDAVIGGVGHEIARCGHAGSAGHADAVGARAANGVVHDFADAAAELYAAIAHVVNPVADNRGVGGVKKIKGGVGRLVDFVPDCGDFRAVQRAHAIAGRARHVAVFYLHVRAVLGVNAVLAGLADRAARDAHLAIRADVDAMVGGVAYGIHAYADVGSVYYADAVGTRAGDFVVRHVAFAAANLYAAVERVGYLVAGYRRIARIEEIECGICCGCYFILYGDNLRSVADAHAVSPGACEYVVLYFGDNAAFDLNRVLAGVLDRVAYYRSADVGTASINTVAVLAGRIDGIA